MWKFLKSLVTDWIVVCTVLIGYLFLTFAVIAHVAPTGEGSVIMDGVRGNDILILILAVTTFPAYALGFILAIPFWKLHVLKDPNILLGIFTYISQTILYSLAGKSISWVFKREKQG